MNKKRTIVLYDGEPKPSRWHNGTQWLPKVHKDRWGILPPGSRRDFCIDLKLAEGNQQHLDIPLSWFGKKKQIHVKIVAEITS